MINESLWRKINYIFGLLAIGVLFGLMVFFANTEINDLDLWLHLGMGKFITQNGYVPDVDILSYTIAGHPWVNHEWLFQVLVYFIFNQWGPNGLILMQVVLVSLTLLILLVLGYDKDRQFLVALTLFLVLALYQIRFTIRPDLFSLLFFSLYIFILSLFIDRKWSLLVLFVIQVIWSNFHGFFFFGPLFVLIGLTMEWIKRHVKLPYEWNEVGRLNDEEYARLKSILVFVVMACFINPLTFKGAWYPIGVFFQLSGESKIFFEHIQELQKPILLNNIFDLSEFIHFKALILISLLSFIYNRRKIDIGVLFFWLAFLIFSLMAIRNVPFFAFTAYLVIVTNAVTLSLNDILPFRFVDKRFKYVTAIVFKILFIFWILNSIIDMSSRGYFDFDKYERKSEMEGVSQRGYADKAVDFLVDNKIAGNIFNDFNSGAYLVGRCFPDIKVFIDGRTEVYGPRFFQKYQKIYNEGDFEAFQELAKRFHITIALFNSSKGEIPREILKKFYDSKEWTVVYFDYDGVVFLKNVPENKELLARFGLDLSKWKAKGMDLRRLGARRVHPYHNINRAFTLEALGLYPAALAEAEAALKVSPCSTDPYKIIGKIFAKEKNFQKAFENFRMATAMDTGSRENRFNLAQSYLDLGEYKYGIEQYEKLVDYKPGDPKAYFLLAKAHILAGQPDSGREILTKAHKLDPKNLSDLLTVADLLSEKKDHSGAKAVLELALETGKRPAEVYNKLGLVLRALGEEKSAKEVFEKGLAIDPEDKELKKNLQKMSE
ncbi:MAG: tetratricopeptide repeat protein [Candidatus Omnitrophota bacterium]